MLEITDIFEGLGLPLEIGGVQLEAVALHRVISVAPFKGQVMAVADALRPLIGMTLPPVGQCAETGKVSAYWQHQGQWLVFGESGLMRETLVALSGMAAVTDMSDSLGKLGLAGKATPVLARLCALDLEEMPEGRVAHTSLADIPVTIIAVKGGFELLVPRSLAGSAVRRLEVAMRSVAAQALLA